MLPGDMPISLIKHFFSLCGGRAVIAQGGYLGSASRVLGLAILIYIHVYKKIVLGDHTYIHTYM